MAIRCKQIFLLITFTLFLSGISAQQPFVRNYSVSDGLPSNEIYEVFQDSRGFLWFGTDAGVSCYDGYRFVNYTSRDGLPDNVIFGFFEDAHGRIWFRSFGLLSYFDGTKIVAPPVNSKLRSLLNGQLVHSVYVTPGDTIIIGSQGVHPLIKVLPGFETIAPEESVVPGSAVVREMAPGKFIFSSRDEYSPVKELQFYAQNASAPVRISNATVNLYGMYCLHFGASRTIIGFGKDYFEISGNSVAHYDNPSPVVRLISAGDNRYWRCLSMRKGVELVEEGPDGSRHVLRSLLDGYTVTGCLRDHEGGTWFTTLEKGLFYMPSEGIELYYPLLAPGEKITCITTFGGEPLAATSMGALIRPGKTEIETGENRPAYVSSLLAFHNRLFVCAQHNSQIREEGKVQAEPIRDSTGKIPLYGVAVFDENHFYALSVRALYSVDARTSATTTVAALLPERMRGICRGNGDTIWLGGYTGLWMLLPGKQPMSMNALDPRLGQRIDFLFFDKVKNRLWISTKGGGLLLKQGKTITEFNPSVAANCRALSQDEQGNIWVATNAGAFCVSEKNGRFSAREFSVRNGLPSNDIVGIVRIGDTVWMAASESVIRFRLEDYPNNKVPPPLLMRSVSVNGHPVSFSPGETLELSHVQNTIAFSFTGLSYKSFGQVLYRFRLNGADSSWQETNAKEVTFYNLPPGDYRFSLYALNSDGHGQARPLEFSFVILRPFWQRWWFITIASLVLIAGVIGFYIYNVKRVKRKELFNRRLIEMEMTALRAQISPHFIFNAINSIHNFVLQGDRNSSATYLAKFSRLIRNVLEHSGQKQIPLMKELETLQLYMEIEQMRFSDGFSFRIETDPSLNLGAVMCVPLLLQPYVENAIWHGLMHKKSKGMLLLSIHDEGTMLRCVIDDDGIGREQAAIYRRQRTTGGTSMGGEISLRRLNLLNSLYGTKFSIQYTDKKNEDGSPAGTRVELMIPKIMKNDSR